MCTCNRNPIDAHTIGSIADGGEYRLIYRSACSAVLGHCNANGVKAAAAADGIDRAGAVANCGDNTGVGDGCYSRIAGLVINRTSIAGSGQHCLDALCRALFQVIHRADADRLFIDITNVGITIDCDLDLIPVGVI